MAASGALDFDEIAWPKVGDASIIEGPHHRALGWKESWQFVLISRKNQACVNPARGAGERLVIEPGASERVQHGMREVGIVVAAVRHVWWRSE